MTGLLDASGRSLDPLLTPKQNQALHQQTRQMLVQKTNEMGEHFQELFYKQALFLEFLVSKINNSDIDLNIDDTEFATYAEARHAEIIEQMKAEQAAKAENELAEATAQAQELLGSGVSLSE